MRRSDHRLLSTLLSIQGDARHKHTASRLESLVSGCSGQDRGRIQEWANAVIRHRKTLRALIASSVRRALKKARPEFQVAFEMAALVTLLDGLEAGEKSVKGFTEGLGRKHREKILRGCQALDESVTERQRQATLDWPEVQERLAQDPKALVLRVASRWLIFAADPLELESRSQAARLALQYSLPEDLSQRWLDDYGPEQSGRMAFVANERAPLFARANRLRTNADQLCERLTQAGLGCQRRPERPDGLQLTSKASGFRKTPSFTEGQFSIQDLSAQEVPLALAPEPGERVLDLCAAPGGKSCYLAELMEDRGQLLAVDRKQARLERVEQNQARLGLSCIECVVGDGRDLLFLEGQDFDRVLVDGPCSNTGVLRRRPEARWRYSRRNQQRFVQDQRALLQLAASRVKKGGRLVYSLCSVEADEGPELVRDFLQASGFELLREKRQLPELNGGDGGYFAVLSH